MFIEVKPNHVSLNDKTNLLATRLIKKPKFVIGANFGPYKSNSYLDLYKLIFNEFKSILLFKPFLFLPWGVTTVLFSHGFFSTGFFFERRFSFLFRFV